MALLDYLFPPQDNQMMGLLGGDEEKMRQAAQRAGLLNTGLGIIAASGPSRMPQGILQPVASGLMAGQEAYQGTIEQQQKQLAMRQKAMLEQEKLNQPKFQTLGSASGNQRLVQIGRDNVPRLVDLPGMGGDEKPIDFSPTTRAWMNQTFGTAVYENLSPTQKQQALTRELTTKKELSGLQGGINPNAMPVGKEGTNVVDKDLLTIGRSRVGLTRVFEQLKPEYLTVPFQTKMNIAAGKERIGLSLNETDKAQLADYSQFVQTSMQGLNQYINDITGAAVGAGDEEKRLRAGIPDPQKDSPTQFQAKLQNTLALGKLYEARLGYVKKNGLKLTDVSIDSIPSKMRAREAEIIQQLKLDPTKPEDKAAIRSKLASEFGLLD
jgi:hypothetical protein